jgi:16S rRNA (guanine966-N2)-methyltransferase
LLPPIEQSLSKIRITGGAWRSRLIQVADAPGLRPTPDRVRETLFNWLGQDLTGWHCLDLFAGSGILGFECASRGAESVVLVERDQGAFARLKQNAALFADARLRLERADALEFAGRKDRTFDLVLLDPPYHQGWLDKVAPLLPALARPGMRVYAEAERRIATLGEWRTLKQGQAGQVFYHLLENSLEHS